MKTEQFTFWGCWSTGQYHSCTDLDASFIFLTRQHVTTHGLLPQLKQNVATTSIRLWLNDIETVHLKGIITLTASACSDVRLWEATKSSLYTSMSSSYLLPLLVNLVWNVRPNSFLLCLYLHKSPRTWVADNQHKGNLNYKIFNVSFLSTRKNFLIT